MTAPTLPQVSAVVPTVGRPRLVVRAVASALSQTLGAIEVVVVLDGFDPATANALGAIADERLRLEVLPRRSGIGAARNAGVRAAHARWIAFLDDDDEWSPGKLEAQLRVASASVHAHPIVACRLIVCGDGGPARIWPRRMPAPGEPLSEYLFTRRSVFWGDALVHTSTLLVERTLLDAVPFDERLVKHEDLDWLLRASRVEGAAVEFVPSSDPLATWNADDGRPRASTTPSWRHSLAWIESLDGVVTRRAFAGFVLTWIAADAVRERDLSALWRLPSVAWRRGRPRVLDLLIFVAIWTVPPRVRRRLGSTLRGAP